MALQNFFVKTDNYRRATPNQTSGREMRTEFYMRNNGESRLVVTIIGIQNIGSTISARVIVKDPDTGLTVFDTFLTCFK